MDEFSLDRRLRQILGDDRFFEGPILLGILQGLYDGLGSQSVLERIAARLLLSVLSLWAGARESIAAVRLELPERRHEAFGFDTSSFAAGAFAADEGAWCPSALVWVTAIVGVIPVIDPERRVFLHNISAILTESSPSRLHHARSSRERWSSR
jgi:hypothetical protein